MAKPEVHPSFFAEEMYYHLRDEQYPQPDYNHNTLVSSSPEATLTSRPLLPTAAAPPTVSMPSFISTKAESESSLPRPRVLAGHVNVSQVLPITDELWNSVSVDYDADASTPGSDETANSTLTPRLDLPFPFTQPFFQQGFGGNTVTGGYAAKHAVFNPSALHTAAMQPSSTITPVSPKAVMPASVFAQDQHVAQGPSRLADIPRQENLVLDSGVSTKNDPVDTLLDAPAPEDGNVPNARYPRSNSSMDPHARRKWESKLLFREWKKGTPYRRIKAMGNFNVAESTLRGRIRTMIKGKSEKTSFAKL
ncbi:hypothetical protein KC357_g9239 [Hortaea werneckii]|nr:hypothetical protein KC357_g9239 [Hortaea werneckii]